MITDRRPRDDRPLLPSTTPRWNIGDHSTAWALIVTQVNTAAKRMGAALLAIGSVGLVAVREAYRPIRVDPLDSRRDQARDRSMRTQLLRVDRRQVRRSRRST